MRRFSVAEIGLYWDDYQAAARLRVLKAGKWELLPLSARPEGATRAEKVRLKDHQTFPEYLKEKANG